jgi:hypothetical protein
MELDPGKRASDSASASKQGSAPQGAQEQCKNYRNNSFGVGRNSAAYCAEWASEDMRRNTAIAYCALPLAGQEDMAKLLLNRYLVTNEQ